MLKTDLNKRYYIEITGTSHSSKHYTIYYKPRLFGLNIVTPKEVGSFTINNFYGCKIIKVLNDLFIKENFRNNGICNLVFEFLINKFVKDDEVCSLQLTTTSPAIDHCCEKYGFTKYNNLFNPITERMVNCYFKNFTIKTV